jgi:hypothetical protein
METAVKEPDDENELRRRAEQEFRERITGTVPASMIEEAIEQARQEFANYTLGRFIKDTLSEEDSRPEGYGKLNETYRWVPVSIPGVGDVVRALCIEHDAIMTTTLKVDPRYGRTQNKHTRGKQAVVYNGKPVLAWECRECSPVQWVVQ